VRNLDERAPHARPIDFGFAARQCFGLIRNIEKPLPADEQVGDDAGRAAVKTFVLCLRDNSREQSSSPHAVATKNSERDEKSRVLTFTAIVFSACLNMRVPSSRSLPADSVAEPLWNWRTSLCVTNYTFCVANGRVGPD
jgi:hypothetical protein